MALCRSCYCFPDCYKGFEHSGVRGVCPFLFTLCVFMFVKIVSDFDSIKIRLCVVEVAVYAVVYFIRVKDLR